MIITDEDGDWTNSLNIGLAIDTLVCDANSVLVDVFFNDVLVEKDFRVIYQLPEKREWPAVPDIINPDMVETYAKFQPEDFPFTLKVKVVDPLRRVTVTEITHKFQKNLGHQKQVRIKNIINHDQSEPGGFYWVDVVDQYEIQIDELSCRTTDVSNSYKT